ncbi:MAG: response regulator [Kofleriaceae bacterium]
MNVILLVEDNPTDEALAVMAFKRSGVAYRLDVVRDGLEALDYVFATGSHAARGAAELPSLLLLDVNLPKLDGLGVLRRIRADLRTAALPVVMLTSSRQDSDVRRAYELGANAYVRKAVDFIEFAANVRALATFWLQVNRPQPRLVTDLAA